MQDSDQILALLESSVSKGQIETYYTRRPNAVQSYQYEGNPVRIVTLRNEAGEIVVKMILAMRQVYLNGTPTEVCYCTGIRVKNGFQKVNWPKRLAEYTKQMYPQISLYYLTVLSNNYDAFNVFDKPRPYLPKVERIGDFRLYFIKTGLRKTPSGHPLKQATKHDEPRLLQFLQETGKQYNFFPVLDRLDQAYHGLNIDDFYYIEVENQIVFVCAVWNQQSYKQYVVHQYHGIYRFLHRLPFLTRALGYFRLPKVGSTANCATVSFLLCKEDHLLRMPQFVRSISHSQVGKYDFLIFSREQLDPIAHSLASVRHIPYDSIIHLGYFDENQLLKDVRTSTNPIYLECGLL